MNSSRLLQSELSSINDESSYSALSQLKAPDTLLVQENHDQKKESASHSPKLTDCRKIPLLAN